MAEDSFFRSVQLTELTLRVADLAHVQAFYQDVLGFEPVGFGHERYRWRRRALRWRLWSWAARRAAAATRRGRPVPRRVPVPDRPALARALQRAGSGRPDWLGGPWRQRGNLPVGPEGNGLELYADRPQAAWPPADLRRSDHEYTEALDIPALLGLALSGPMLPAETRIGHVHLSVADLAHADRFYGDALGFTVTSAATPGRCSWGAMATITTSAPTSGGAGRPRCRHAGPGRVHRARRSARSLQGSRRGWRTRGGCAKRPTTS